jgi:hypothetical protein
MSPRNSPDAAWGGGQKNLLRPAVQPISRSYTDWAIQDRKKGMMPDK